MFFFFNDTATTEIYTLSLHDRSSDLGSGTTPLILLDDIFDKLDALRVEQIVKLVAGDNFGQIFITDTNRDHLDRILKKIEGDYKLFEVENGEVSERKESYEAE